jgi:radical SAM protein with 4Fe4S-binding SPASM domain
VLPAQAPLPRRLRRAEDIARRTPDHVVWEITLACNLKCAHCGSRAGRPRQEELSTEECLDVVRQLAELGTRDVNLIGGEAYLRRDWLTIVKAIADAGMHCSIQTGGRGLTLDKIKAAKAAGVGTLGVSIDGPREVHDRLRGFKGSFDQAIGVLRNVAAVGIVPGVNTQINALSKPHLREIFEIIAANGAKSWQVQLTAAMGNAVDNSEMLIQPYEIPDVVDTLAELFERGRDLGLRLLPGNSIGYFGPYEHRWRTLTDEPTHWTGCTAGETNLGLEADGKIKGCPSLPAGPYGAGLTREMTLREAVEALGPKTIRRDGNRGSGFCGSCYYWNVCNGGCTWIAHGISNARGNNPNCYYRARELAKQGLHERIVKVAEAPGQPFDFGRFEIVVEDAAGQRVASERARDSKKRRRGRKLVTCVGCSEYVFASERICPHCEAPQPRRRRTETSAEPHVLSLMSEIDRHSREIMDIVYGADHEQHSAQPPSADRTADRTL